MGHRGVPLLWRELAFLGRGVGFWHLDGWRAVGGGGVAVAGSGGQGSGVVGRRVRAMFSVLGNHPHAVHHNGGNLLVLLLALGRLPLLGHCPDRLHLGLFFWLVLQQQYFVGEDLCALRSEFAAVAPGHSQLRVGALPHIFFNGPLIFGLGYGLDGGFIEIGPERGGMRGNKGVQVGAVAESDQLAAGKRRVRLDGAQ